MRVDLDAFEERAAIMEFDGGLTRYQAETKAARAQGLQRREVMDAIRERHSQQARDRGQALERNGSDNLSAVQPAAQEQARSVPQRDVQA